MRQFREDSAGPGGGASDLSAAALYVCHIHLPSELAANIAEAPAHGAEPALARGGGDAP